MQFVAMEAGAGKHKRKRKAIEPIDENQAENKAKAFRIAARHFFVTYPKCHLHLGEIEAVFRTQGAIAGIVARELHEDGTHHRHVYAEFERTFNLKDARRWDIKGFHPNIQACRSPVDVLRYCAKEENYIVWGGIDVQALILSGGSATKALYTKLYDKKITLPEAVRLNPMFLPQYNRIKEGLSAYWCDTLADAKPLTEFTFTVGTATYTHQWTGRKQEQLYIYGGSNAGKTENFVWELIRAGYKGFAIPFHYDFSGFNPSKFSFIYGDDYRSNLPAGVFLQLGDGRPIRLNAKYGGVDVVKKIPMIITTTRKPEDLYKDMHIDEITNRFKVLQLVGNWPNVQIIQMN